MILRTHRFFRPRERFFDYMEKHRGRVIYDVGAGVGHVTEELLGRGHDVVAMDLHGRDDQSPRVEYLDGIHYPYEPDSVVMLCRPCHGVFPSLVIQQAWRRQVGFVLYVGLPRNRVLDLGSRSRRFTSVLRHAGQDRESVYEWSSGIVW